MVQGAKGRYVTKSAKSKTYLYGCFVVVFPAAKRPKKKAGGASPSSKQLKKKSGGGEELLTYP
jgi:hypothetical protein